MPNDTLSSSSDKNKIHPSPHHQNRNLPSAYDRINHCPKCGYSFRNLPAEGCCPECGWQYNSLMSVFHLRFPKLQVFLISIVVLSLSVPFIDAASKFFFHQSIQSLLLGSIELLIMVILWGIFIRTKLYHVFTFTNRKNGFIIIDDDELILHDPVFQKVLHLGWDEIEKVRKTGRSSASMYLYRKPKYTMYTKRIPLIGLFQSVEEVEQFTRIVNENRIKHRQEQEENS